MLNVKPPLWGMEQSNLLATCFSSIFSLPPAQTIQGMEAALNTKTLKAMDEMLKALVCEDQKSNLVVLQNILEFLFPRTTSKEVHGQLRAVVRISWLIILIAGHHKFKYDQNTRDPQARG
ncbi:maestro heat-like repeat-containing protein family member 7 [Lepidochelys kempii]|uniref:maestro heat-like repeat-containing protein family member 7 n=1 Tax=Lepidochelys kempii TaxID=8472 RepID=UPI003C6F5D55